MAKKTFSFIAACAVALLFAFVFMKVMAMGWKGILAFHGALIFASIAVFFIRSMESFLIFLLFAVLSSGLDFHIVFDPILSVQTGAFAEGVAMDLSDFILLAIAAGWLIDLGISRRRPRVRFDAPVSMIWLAWILWLVIVALLWARATNYALYETIALLKGFFLFLFIVNFPLKRYPIKLMAYGLFMSAIAHASYAIFQFLTRSYFTVAGSDPRYLAPEGFRSIGWLGSPDGTAILIVTVVPMMLAFYFIEPKRSVRMALICGLGICVAGILVTKVRIAGLSFLIGIFVVFVMGIRKGWIGYGATIKALTLSLLVLILLSPFIIHRFEKGSWGEARIPLLITASNMIKKHWATGVGPSNYLFHIEENLPMKLRGSWEAIVHNEYMLRLAETGMIGFILYYLLLFVVSGRLFRLISVSSDPLISATAAGILGAIAGSLVHRMTSIYHLPAIYTQYCAFFGMAGLMYFLETGDAHENENTRSAM